MKILTNTRLTPWDFDENIKQIQDFDKNINKYKLTPWDFDENINKYKAYPLRFWWKY